MQIRAARESDHPAILAIFNHAIETSMSIWIDTPVTLEERQMWFASRQANGFPVLVAEENEVIGFGSFGVFRPYEGFRNTVEHSVYIAENAQGRGAGKALLAALVERARNDGRRVIVGAVDSRNEASLALHRSMGFTETGRMPRLGEKRGQLLDMVLFQKELTGPIGPAGE